MKRLITLSLGIIFILCEPVLGQGWTKTYGGSSYEVGYSVQQTTDNGYIITGGVTSYENSSEDVLLIKTDANGDSLWTKTFGIVPLIEVTPFNKPQMVGISLQDIQSLTEMVLMMSG